MQSLYDAYYYTGNVHDGNNTNFDDDDFKVGGKLLANCNLKLLYSEDIKLPTNENSIAAILVATHVYC